MFSPNNQKVFELANKFASLSDETAFLPTNDPVKTHEHLLSKFQEQLIQKLHRVINDMEGEMAVLKDRSFHPKMTALLNKLYQDLISIYKNIHQRTPYIGARELIDYVLTRPNNAVIDNLDFLIKDHLDKTNETELQTGKLLQHPQMKSLDALKDLAEYARDFININYISQEITNPSTPIAKKR
jgi:trans-2-enoyl-CoA reductase